MVIKLSRNSWHRKLQRYILNISESPKEDFPNLCPYFWLTIFCLVVFPFVAGVRCTGRYVLKPLGKGLAFIISSGVFLIEEIIFKPFDKYVCLPMEDYFYERLDDKDVIQYWQKWNDMSYEKQAKNRKYFNLVDKYLKEKHPETYAGSGNQSTRNIIRDCINELREKQLQKEYKDDISDWANIPPKTKVVQRDTMPKNRKKELMKIAEITKKVLMVPIIGTLIAIAVYILIYIGKGILWIGGQSGNIWHGILAICYWLVHSVPWLTILLSCLGIAAVIATIAGLIFTIKHFAKKCWISIAPKVTIDPKKLSRVGKALAVPFIFLADVFKYAISTLVNGCKLFFEYAKAVKNNYCPGIDWENE